MKKLAIFVMLVALFAIGVNAVSISSPTMGGENQDRIKSVTTTFTVTNNNTVTMTGVTFAFSAGAENSKYALSVSGPTSIGAGSSATYTLNGTVPIDHPAVDSADLKEKALKIGTITVSGTAGSVDSASVDVLMQAVNHLSIKKARIECDTKSQSVEDGDRVKNLKPGNDCTLELEIENEFDENDKNSQKIGDIAFDSIDISVDSSDGDVDVDEDSDLDDLDANDEDSVTMDLEIDEEADDGTISLDVRVSARDENGALHGESMDVKLEIERLTHDMQIRNIGLTPSVVSACEASNVKVAVSVLNQGKRDEDEAAVEVSVPDLKFIKKVENLELDRDDSTSVSFDIPVAKDSREGVVRVDVKSYFDTSAPSNSGSAELTIEGCENSVEDSVVEPKTQTTVVVPQTQVTPQQNQAVAAPKKQTSFTESNGYVALLVVLSVLIAGAIAALAVVLFRKKHN